MESVKPQVCQCHCVPKLSAGNIYVSPRSFRQWLKLLLKRNLSAGTKRKLKKQMSNLSHAIGFAKKRQSSPFAQTISGTQSLIAGDLVRVRSEQEIQATLNTWNELNGCMFMDAQWQYCGTTQRVLKPVERFVDERDYQVKKARGLVLLEGLICEGTPDYGRCDRSCFYFWREEWLEKIS
jgi:hypothetical protein